MFPVVTGLLAGIIVWVLLRTAADEGISGQHGGRANEGIRRSARYAGLTLLLLGIPVSLVVALVFDIKTGLGVGAIVGLGFAFVNGGHACLQHHSVSRIFLYRKGGGYEFIHRYCLEHFQKKINYKAY